MQEELEDLIEEQTELQNKLTQLALQRKEELESTRAVYKEMCRIQAAVNVPPSYRNK